MNEQREIHVVIGPADTGEGEQVWGAFFDYEKAEEEMLRNADDLDAWRIETYFKSIISPEELLEAVEVKMENGQLDAYIKSEFVPLIGLFLGQAFMLEGGINYVEVCLATPKQGEMILSMQRKQGKTPAQITNEYRLAMKEIQELLNVDMYIRDIPRPIFKLINKITDIAFRLGDLTKEPIHGQTQRTNSEQ